MRKEMPPHWFTPAARRAQAERIAKRLAKRRQQKDDEPERYVKVARHKAKEIRKLCDLLADQFSDKAVGISVSARQVLDACENLWPKECRTQLAKGRE